VYCLKILQIGLFRQDQEPKQVPARIEMAGYSLAITISFASRYGNYRV
jgi:hypothetical protein